MLIESSLDYAKLAFLFGSSKTFAAENSVKNSADVFFADIVALTDDIESGGQVAGTDRLALEIEVADGAVAVLHGYVAYR